MTRPQTIVQVGVNGYGLKHLAEIRRLEAVGRLRLVAAVDPKPGDFKGEPVESSLREALKKHRPDVVGIATPIGTHAALAKEALESGADVLLEKPPTASLAEFMDLWAVLRESGGSVQVGFQALGSAGIGVMRDVLDMGIVGGGARVVAKGAWSRNVGYYQRSRWAGHRVYGGARVADGAVTNPLAHAVSVALAVAGATRTERVRSVETELYRVHDIETDDTAWVNVETAGPVSVQAALTLCADAGADDPSPSVAVVGARGSVTFRYTDDEIDWSVDGLPRRTQRVTRQGLLENLLDHRIDASVPLSAPLEETGAFMCVLEATQTAPLPEVVASSCVVWRGSGTERAPVINDIALVLDESLRRAVPFSATGAVWATGTPTVWRS